MWYSAHAPPHERREAALAADERAVGELAAVGDALDHVHHLLDLANIQL